MLIVKILPWEKIIEMNLVNKNLYEGIIPSLFLQNNQFMKIYKLYSNIIIDYSLKAKVYK